MILISLSDMLPANNKIQYGKMACIGLIRIKSKGHFTLADLIKFKERDNTMIGIKSYWYIKK